MGEDAPSISGKLITFPSKTKTTDDNCHNRSHKQDLLEHEELVNVDLATLGEGLKHQYYSVEDDALIRLNTVFSYFDFGSFLFFSFFFED